MSRKAYGPRKRGATQKSTASDKKVAKPRIYASRAKTPAGKKRALVRAKMEAAKAVFLAEQAERQRRQEIKEAHARGEKVKRRTVVAKALGLAKDVAAWAVQQYEAIKAALLGDPRQEFYNFAHGPIARDHLRRLHTEREKMTTRTGERIAGKIDKYLNHDSLPYVLSIIDMGAESLRGHDLWNITVFLFSDAKELVGSPTPIESGQGRFQASFTAGGIAESYREARAGLERELRTMIDKTAGLLYALYYMLFTRAAKG